MCLQHKGSLRPAPGAQARRERTGLAHAAGKYLLRGGSAGLLAPPLLGASTQKGEGGEISSAGCKEKLHSGGREERSFSGNFAFSNLHILGFSINFPFVFSHCKGVGVSLCALLLEFEGVSEHAVGQVGPGVGLLGAGWAGGEVGRSDRASCSLAGRCERVSLRRRGVHVACRG